MASHRSVRTRVILAAVSALIGSLLYVEPAAAVPDKADPPPALKIEDGLERSLDAAGTADFMVSFAARPDLAGTADTDWTRRGRKVLDALDRSAADSQRDVRRQLDAAKVRYRSFSVANVIYVFDGTEDLANRLAGRAEVTRLDPARTYALPKPVPSKTKAAIDEAVEWGVADIRADQVWTGFGTRGEGIVVANIDTGVQYDHPALAASYRGKQADGSLRHDYNWYDPSAVCPPGLGPCDNAGHGTHTMGTMVGDAGAGNRIGVAPGAKWIAAKGCEGDGCSSFALLASAQWVLAPTDQQGLNPRPDLRPNVVNNSWGAPTGPVEDPWYDDAIKSWVAAGMFPAFANGNSGEAGCDSAETPGDSLVAYAVGAYAADHTIASFSSRGPGADGTPKPNLAAPGVAVRSSLPGNTYDAWDGTSMATPHLAATVALMWAAAPAILGDVEATEALLDETAIDTDDTRCGGTAADNNVFGEGRLDAYRAVEAAPRGPTGTLRGTVRSALGEVLGGATVRLAGTAPRRLQTAPDGTFRALLSTGDYTVTVSRFGYADQTATVSVPPGGDVVRDFSLEVLPRVAISGRVTEASAHGWPVYAELAVDGVPDGTYHSDPATGNYRFELPAGTTYTMRVRPAYPGLSSVVEQIPVGSEDVVRDVRLTADPYACTAPGYKSAASRIAYQQTFDEPSTPSGWTVTDPLGNNEVWRFDDEQGFGNRTGGDGFYAWVFSAGYGPDEKQDTALVSPSVDLSDTTTPAVWFHTDYSDGPTSTADVDLSLDGGETWTNVWRQTNPSLYETYEQVPIPQAAGEPDVRVRFHYTASFDTWWQVDDVALGERVCDTVPGGLMLGHVRDANTGKPLVGSAVRGTSVSTVSVATPADPGLDDGFYWMFVPGSGSYSASQTRYQTDTKTVTVPRDAATRADFAPTAGVLAIDQASVSGSVAWGGRTTARLTVRNTGTATARLDLGERHGDVSVLTRQTGAPLQRIPGKYSLHAKPSGSVSTEVAKPAGTDGGPWTGLPDYPVPIMDNAVAYQNGELYSIGGRLASGATVQSYRYDPETAVWTRIADLPRARQMASVGFIGGKLYAAGGWTTTGDARADMDVYDPVSDTWSPGPSMPGQTSAAGTAVVGDQLFVIGGCISECGHQETFRYDVSDRKWTRVADYPRDTAWMACGGIDGSVYCAGGSSEGGSSARTYRYNAAANTWTRLADLPASLWGMGWTVAGGQLLVSGGVIGSSLLTNQGWSYDPATNTWSALPNSQRAYYRGGSACGFARVGGSAGNFIGSQLGEILPGYTDCGDGDPVPWLQVAPSGVTLAPGTSAQVTVTLDGAAVDQPGTYTAGIAARDTTPYTAPAVTATLQVAAPAGWGKLTGTISGRACDGVVTPLPAATIRADGPLADRVLHSDAGGNYTWWLDKKNSPLQLTVVRDGWFPATGQALIRAGRTTVADFTLNRTGCPGRVR